MARFRFRLPDIGEGIAEAEIVRWHARPGEAIGEDAPLVDMMTDKATIEIESPVSGTLLTVAGAAGDRVAIGALLAEIETDGESAAAMSGAHAAAPAPAPAPAAPVSPSPEVAGRPRAIASPAVRTRARALGIDLAQVPSTGGHVRHGDLDAFLRHRHRDGYASGPSAAPDEQVPVIGLRRQIAEAMRASRDRIAHFSYVEEVEVTALEQLRAQLNAGRGDRPQLTLLPLLIAAMCRTLPQFPMLNARYDDEAGVVTRHGTVHMGVATALPQGLVVPVIRDAQALNLWQLADEIARLSSAAHAGTLARAEMAGGTITISSLGRLGGIAATPIVNRPEVAIIAPGRIIERPVFADATSDRIRRARLMNLSISCDHRVVDGHEAAGFVQALKLLLEAPALILAPA